MQNDIVWVEEDSGMKNRMRIAAAAVGFCIFLSACANAPARTPDSQADDADHTYTETLFWIIPIR